jgi:hypothetical protein
MTIEEIKPTRCLVNAEGEAISFLQYESRGLPTLAVVWVRKDGWMFAAPHHLSIAARNLWHTEWAGVYNRVGGTKDFTYNDLTGKENRLADFDA